METDATLNKLFAFNNVSVYLNKVYFVPFITAFGQIGLLMIDYQNTCGILCIPDHILQQSPVV